MSDTEEVKRPFDTSQDPDLDLDPDLVLHNYQIAVKYVRFMVI